jgi:hypothetical protein
LLREEELKKRKETKHNENGKILIDHKKKEKKVKRKGK